jgi:hypothetical protein
LAPASPITGGDIFDLQICRDDGDDFEVFPELAVVIPKHEGVR